MKQGNVQITFGDGRKEVIIRDGKCSEPELSKTGAVYWTHCTGINERGYPLDEKIIVRNRLGAIIELRGVDGYPVLRNSAFTTEGGALVAMCGVSRHACFC
jgi:hypothetical protein